jgi:hypothetical protein
MKQTTFVYTGFELVTKRKRKLDFHDKSFCALDGVDWLDHAIRACKQKGRLPFLIATMLRIHFMQQWFGFSNARHN